MGNQVWRFRSPGLYDDNKATTSANNNNELHRDNKCLNFRFKDGSTPLTRALKSRDLDAVMEILQRPGIDVNLTEIPQAQLREVSKPPLVVAVINGSKELVHLLLDAGVDVNAPDGEGLNALYHAVDRGLFETVKLLINNKANLQCSHQGYDPLHAACRHGNFEMTKLLVAAGSPVDPQKDTAYLSPLQLALQQKQEDLCLFLLQNGADWSGKHDMVHPFLTACLYGLTEVVKYLIDDGCDVNVKLSDGTPALTCAVNMSNYQSDRILMLGLAETNTSSLNVSQKKLLATRMALVQILCANGFKRPLKSKTVFDKGEPVMPLHVALQKYNLPSAVVLLQHGAEWDSRCFASLLHFHEYINSSIPISNCLKTVIQTFLPLIINMLSHSERMDFWKVSTGKYQVPALKDCCRQVIRAQVLLNQRTFNDDVVSILPRIRLLNLPATLQDYLSFEEFNRFSRELLSE